MKEQLDRYIKQVKEWHIDCRDNEQATKASLIAPLFVILGYNMTDPHECKPEYRMDFGRGEKAATPVDWAFLIDGAFAFFVEAKEAGAKIARYPEQLGMYFGKQPGMNGVKLGILTNGTQWRFFTDLRNDNAMDTEPFFTWDLLKDDPALAMDLLTILQKSEFTRQRIRTFAERRRHQTLLAVVLDRLLKPSSEFVKLAITTGVNDAGDTLVSGKITEKVIEQWKPILRDAIHEWVKQLDLTMALQPQTQTTGTSQGLSTTLTRARSKSKGEGVALTDLIAAGILSPPLKLLRKYKGKMLEATLLAGGVVEFQGQRYDTCSGAAEAARATVSGHRMNTNGWTFWQYRDAAGKRHGLDDARKHGGKAKQGQQAQLVTRDQPERHSLRKKFWQGLITRAKAKNTRHGDIAPSEYSWIAAGSGVRGCPFTYAIGQNEGRVELFMDRGTGKADENKRMFDWLLKHKSEIEQAFGGVLDWQRLDDKQGCRIAHALTVGGYRSDVSKWPGIQDAMIDAMTRLENALTPLLPKLNAEFAS